MNWHVYDIAPIDSGWDNLRTVQEMALDIGQREVVDKLADCGGSVSPDVDEFLSRWKSAQQAARDAGWEGDFRHDPAVFWIPGDTDFQFGFVFKQDNNGTTFVVSPVELPSVDALTC